MSIFKAAIASTLSLALLASQLSPAAAAPLPTNVATMKSIAANGPVQVHWHGGWGWGVGAGFLAGAVIGGAIASGGYGYYGAPYYAYGYPSYPYYGYYAPRVVYYGYEPYYGYGAYGYYRPYRVYGYRHYWHRHHYRYW
jgi:hypothetical protein